MTRIKSVAALSVVLALVSLPAAAQQPHDSMSKPDNAMKSMEMRQDSMKKDKMDGMKKDDMADKKKGATKGTMDKMKSQ